MGVEHFPEKFKARLVKRGDLVPTERLNPDGTFAMLVNPNPHIGWSVSWGRPVVGTKGRGTLIPLTCFNRRLVF